MKNSILFAIFIIICNGVIAQTIPSYVDTNGLLAWYPFSGNANNAYGTGLNGSVIGPALTADRFGNVNSAYHFNGKADHILIDTAFFNVGWSNFTISWWMQNDTTYNPFGAYYDQCCFSTIPEDGIVMDVNWGGTSNKYSIWANANPSLYATWTILSGSESHSSITKHIWNHFTLEKENDTSYYFYINGVLDSVYTSPVIALNYYCRFNIGNIDSTVPNEGTLGALDDYGIWTRTLSNCEIKKMFHSTTHLFITAEPVNVSAVLSSTVKFSVTDTGTGDTYQWQANTGPGYTNLAAAPPYSGVTTATLTVTGITSTLNGHQYRCVVTGPGGCVDTSDKGVLTITSLGINPVNNYAGISIVPNPAIGDISIKGCGPVDIKIFNTEGQRVKQAANTSQVSIADIPPGLYFIKLFDAQGSLIYYDRLLKQ